MFCPKCGDELINHPRGMFCKRGNMQLSKHLSSRLMNCFVLKTEEPSDHQFKIKLGVNFFCPGCGVRTVEEDGYIRCPECHLSMNEFVFRLIEMHPHSFP